MDLLERLKPLLDPGQAVLAGLAAGAGLVLALIGLEVAHAMAVGTLSGNGFAAWGDAGYYVRNQPGVALSVTSLPGQGAILWAVLYCGLALGALALLGQLLYARQSREAMMVAALPVLIFVPLALAGIASATASEPCLTLDLVHDAITVPPGNYLLSVSGLAQFDTYTDDPAQDSYTELGATSTDGHVFDLSIAIPATWGSSHYAESQHLIGALMQFVTSKGQSFPAR